MIREALPLALAAFALSAAAQPVPSVDRQIDPTRFDDGNRAIVLRVPHQPDPGAPTSIRLVKSRAYVRQGDVGPILVETYYLNGGLRESWRAPRPGERTRNAAPGTEARYAIPYEKSLAAVSITDTERGTSIWVRLDPVIEAFCLSQPDDVACDKVDLTASISLADPRPRNIKTGDSESFTVNSRFTNRQGETNGAVMAVRPFFVSPNLRVETTDETSLSENRIDGSFSRQVSITYTVTCETPGAGRIFPEAVIQATAGPAVVDINPNNNRDNTILDVLCITN
jgi:hypothetical protein